MISVTVICCWDLKLVLIAVAIPCDFDLDQIFWGKELAISGSSLKLGQKEI
jgi:hypothetical protein